jgi:beta-lactamase regulating signal transducer with metallopeptidase domain
MMLLLEAALHAGALGAAVWIGLKALRTENPHVEMMVWKVVLVASLAMPLLLPWATVRLPDWPFPALVNDRSGSTPTPQAEPRSMAAPDVSDWVAARSDRSVSSPDPAPSPARPPAESNSGSTLRPVLAATGWVALVSGLYVLISGALLLQLLTGIVLIFRLSRAARPFNADWTAGAHVRVSESVTLPVTFASTILLPGDCQTWDALKRRAVMSHEKSHIERGDFYWLLLAALHRVVFWFNPLAWWLVRRLGELMEVLSDDAVIEDLGDAPAYAEILLDVAGNPRSTRAGIAMARSPTIAWRVDRILAAAIPVRPGAGKRLLVAVSVIPLVAISAVGIGHSTAAGTEPSVVDAQAASTSRAAPAGDAESELNDMFARLFADPAGSRATVSIDPAAFDRHVGSFRIDSGLILTITREGDQFFAQLTGQPKVQIYPQSEIEFFFATAVDARISLLRGQPGSTDFVIFHQNGRDRPARRVDATEALAAEVAFQQRRAADEGRQQAATFDATSADPYVGFYGADPNDVFVITREGQQLFAQLTGQRKLPLFPAGGNAYAYAAANALMTFVTEGNSPASELVLHLKSRDLHVPRVGDLPNAAAGHVDVDPGLFNFYVGTYQVDLRTVIVITRNEDGVFVAESGQPKREVIPRDLDDYVSLDGQVHVVFSRDGTGWARGLILYDEVRGARQATKLVVNDIPVGLPIGRPMGRRR